MSEYNTWIPLRDGSEIDGRDRGKHNFSERAHYLFLLLTTASSSLKVITDMQRFVTLATGRRLADRRRSANILIDGTFVVGGRNGMWCVGASTRFLTFDFRHSKTPGSYPYVALRCLLDLRQGRQTTISDTNI